MWPVRTRRGTRKRCAILFVVVVCATVMVLTRPFVTTPVTQLEDLGIPLPQVAPGSSLSTTTVSSISRNLTTMSSNSSIIVVTTTTPASTPKTTSVSHTVSEIRMTSSSSETDQSVPLSSSPPPAFKPKNASVETSGAPPASVPPSSEKALVPETGGNESSAGVVPSSTLPLPPPPSSSAPPTVYSSIVPEPTPSHVEVGSGRGSLFKKEIDSVTLSKMPTIYVITPTFPRVEQMAEMTRLSQTLMHVPKLHWIVAEDARSKSPELEALLQRTGLAYTYVLGAMPESFRKKKGNKPKGVANRLAGLQWIRDHANDNGVMFFADDDNTYDIRLFEEVRAI